MNSKSTLILVGLAALISLSLFTGCTTNINHPPYKLEKKKYYYPPLNIPEINNKPPQPSPLPSVLPGGSLNGVTIIVDAGHGGKDPGAGTKTRSSTPEKSINLAVAKELEMRLRAKGARVIMSRKNDTFIELDDRAAMAERYNADLLVSIHADSCPDRYIRGSSVYVARNCSYKSLKTARNIRDSFVNNGITFKKIGNRDFRVLAKHSKPAVLVECGYMTNAQEAKILNQTWYRNKLANAIAEGIENTF